MDIRRQPVQVHLHPHQVGQSPHLHPHHLLHQALRLRPYLRPHQLDHPHYLLHPHRPGSPHLLRQHQLGHRAAASRLRMLVHKRCHLELEPLPRQEFLVHHQQRFLAHHHQFCRHLQLLPHPRRLQIHHRPLFRLRRQLLVHPPAVFCSVQVPACQVHHRQSPRAASLIRLPTQAQYL